MRYLPHFLGLVFIVLVQSAITAEPNQGSTAPKAGPIRVDAQRDLLPAGALTRLGAARFRSGGSYRAVGISPDGKLLAVAHRYGGVEILDASSGKEVRTLGSRFLGVMHLVFLSSNELLVGLDKGFGPLEIWDTATGKSKVKLQMKSRLNYDTKLIVSRDGSILAVGNDGPGQPGEKRHLHVWDLKTGKSLGPFEVVHSGRTGVTLSADGKKMASWGSPAFGAGNSDVARIIQLWDVATAKEVRKFKSEFRGDIREAALTPDGKTLAATAGQSTVILWDVESGKELRRMTGRSGMRWLCFTPDCKTLLTGSDDVVQLWDTASGRPLGMRDIHAPIQSLALLPDNRILAVGRRGQAIVISELTSGTLLTPAGGHTAWLEQLGFSPDSKTVISADRGGKVIFWDRNSGNELYHFLMGDRGSFMAYGRLTLSSGGKYAISANSGSIQLWDLSSRKVHADIGEHDPVEITTLALSPDATLFASCDRQGRVQLWDALSGQIMATLADDAKRFGQGGTTMTFSADGRIFAFAASRYDLQQREQVADAVVVDVQTKKSLLTLKSIAASHSPALALSPDGELFAFAAETGGGGGQVRLRDVASGQKLQPLDTNSTITSLAFSPDGRTLACGVLNLGGPKKVERGVILWELASGQERARLKGHEDNISRLAFSPDGRVLASGSWDTTVLLWDTTGKLLHGSEPLKAKDVKAHWDELRQNADRAFQAMGQLHSSPKETVAFFKENLKVRGDKSPTGTADEIRDLRGVELLEYLDTDDARALLRALAAGAPARLTREAQAAVRRLASRK